MQLDVTPFRVREGETVKLKHRPTKVAPFYDGNTTHDALLAQHVAELDRLQQKLYAADSHAVLLIFQAMDAAGKDGVIRHVMSGINPQGCQVFSFKHPSAEELQHDFLWRCTRDLPARGQIGIFNRSYYEEVLIVRVHPELLHPQGVTDPGPDPWTPRYEDINAFERHLTRSGTIVLKFCLHLSKEEQRERLLCRLETPDKMWKASDADLIGHSEWDAYVKAYEAMLANTSTPWAPWHVVPADRKWVSRCVVGAVVVAAHEGLGLEYPQPSGERREKYAELAKALEAEA